MNSRDRLGLQLLARPAEQLLPRGVQQREAAVERDRRKQIARHLEQPRDRGSPRASDHARRRDSASGEIASVDARRLATHRPASTTSASAWPAHPGGPRAGRIAQRWRAADLRWTDLLARRPGVCGRATAAQERAAPSGAAGSPPPASASGEARCVGLAAQEAPDRQAHEYRHDHRAATTHHSQIAWSENSSR